MKRTSIDLIVECLAAWLGETAHLRSHAKELIASLFEHKGAQLFEEQYSSVARRIHQLAELSDDKRFVLEQILKKVAIDEIELDGDEWLQLAISLCEIASGAAALEAFELVLSGTASRFADEMGEGPYRPEFAAASLEPDFLADVLWHLLGDDDAYVRWSVARSLSTAVELGLNEELGCFSKGSTCARCRRWPRPKGHYLSKIRRNGFSSVLHGPPSATAALSDFSVPNCWHWQNGLMFM